MNLKWMSTHQKRKWNESNQIPFFLYLKTKFVENGDLRRITYVFGTRWAQWYRQHTYINKKCNLFDFKMIFMFWTHCTGSNTNRNTKYDFTSNFHLICKAIFGFSTMNWPWIDREMIAKRPQNDRETTAKRPRNDRETTAKRPRNDREIYFLMLNTNFWKIKNFLDSW